MQEEIENLFNNVNHLIECQRFVEERVIFLEQKRIEISCWISNLGPFQYKDTLKNEINQMEIRVLKIVDVETKTKIDPDNSKQNSYSVKKCRYHNRGYCKCGSNCIYYHPDKNCDKYIADGKCADPVCSFRHPKPCKFWLKDKRGCYRNELCKYLHRNSEKGINVAEENIEKKVKTKKCDNTKDDNPQIEVTGRVETNEKEDTDGIIAKMDELKDNISAKEEQIQNLEVEAEAIKTDKDNLISQADRFKRIMKNMADEIKLLKGKK